MITALGSLPVPRLSAWSAAADDEPLKLRISVHGAGNADANGKYVFVPRRRYWRNPDCTLVHRAAPARVTPPHAPLALPPADNGTSASGVADTPGGWQIHCYDNKVQYRAPDCHDKSPCTCAGVGSGWIALRPAVLPLPTLCEVVAPSVEQVTSLRW